MVLIMEYDGTNYYGFQLQATLPTIQGEIESALWKLTREKNRVLAASRTDTGVHAREQVVSFRMSSPLPLKAFTHGLNHYLPDDIASQVWINGARPPTAAFRLQSHWFRRLHDTGSVRTERCD